MIDYEQTEPAHRNLRDRKLKELQVARPAFEFQGRLNNLNEMFCVIAGFQPMLRNAHPIACKLCILHVYPRHMLTVW